MPGCCGHALPAGRPLILHVEESPQAVENSSTDLWAVLEKHAGSVEAPADQQAEHDHHLYGTPERQENPDR